VGKDHTHGITLRKAQPKPDREKSWKLAPSYIYMGMSRPYGWSLDPCFEAQPTTIPLHEGSPTIGMFTHADQGNLSGFCNRRLWNFSNCVADLEWLRKWGVHKDLYWFGPPKSSTLHPVHDVVLFTLICSRGYRWVREVAWSQVSVVCRSHVWLKVEGERERGRERGRESFLRK
jgi:hypothetical protein